MQKLTKDEKNVVNELVKNILVGKTQEFAVIIKTEMGNELSITSEGAKTMVGKIYRDL